MKPESFLNEITAIEEYLFGHVPDFDRSQGLSKLLRYFRLKNVFPDELLRKIDDLWKLRNKLFASPTIEEEIPKEATDNILAVKQRLNI